MSYQTSQDPPPAAPYPLDTGGVEPAADNPNGGEQPRRAQERAGRHENQGGNRLGRRKRQEQDRHSRKFPTWQLLLMTGALALVCGGAGAWGYSRFFASDRGDHGKSGSSKDGQGGKSDSQKTDASKSDPGSDSDSLKQQLKQLADGMDDLGARIERLNKATQEARIPVAQYYPGTSRIERMTTDGGATPTLQHSSQAQLTVLQRKVEELAGLPERVQQLEKRINELQESNKTPVETRTDE